MVRSHEQNLVGIMQSFSVESLVLPINAESAGESLNMQLSDPAKDLRRLGRVYFTALDHREIGDACFRHTTVVIDENPNGFRIDFVSE